LLVASVWHDMITGNSGSDTKCQPRRRSMSVGSDELKEHDEHETQGSGQSLCAA
jgi:hypothetical protein